MNRRILVLGSLLAVVAVSFGFHFIGRYRGPGAEELGAELERDLSEWNSEVVREPGFSSDRLASLAERVMVPYPPEGPVVTGTLIPDRKLTDPLYPIARDAALADAAAGRVRAAVVLLSDLVRQGEDACRGQGFDAEFHPAVKAGEKGLRDLTRDEVLGGEALELAIAFERGRLETKPGPAEAWRFRLLSAQVALQAALRGPRTTPQVGWAGPVKRFFGLITSEPTRDDYLRAWHGLRTVFRPLLDAAETGDEEGIARAADGIRAACGDPDGSIFARAASQILVYGDLARDNHENWLRTREARLFGMLMLRHRERHGAFPEDLETIRVEEIPRSPHGGTWRLGIDRETKKPAVCLDGGRVYTYQVLAPQEGDFHGDRETKPLFSFR